MLRRRQAATQQRDSERGWWWGNAGQPLRRNQKESAASLWRQFVRKAVRNATPMIMRMPRGVEELRLKCHIHYRQDVRPSSLGTWRHTKPKRIEPNQSLKREGKRTLVSLCAFAFACVCCSCSKRALFLFTSVGALNFVIYCVALRCFAFWNLLRCTSII